MSTQYQIAFWNLENLFDIENSPRRSDKLQRTIGRAVQGWTQVQLDRKISQLASIIRQMNNNRGPDILGVCEVENAHVMNLLAQALAPLGRNYAVEHHDMSDGRGIDVGFIYDTSLFSVEAQFSHVIVRRNATRDIFQVNFMTNQNRRLVLVGNHWPSRLGGKLESAGYRAIAGETLAYFHKRILEVVGNETPVIAMGDFNDEPFDRSIVNYARAIRSHKKVTNARSPHFLNLMWPVMGQGKGSHYYNNSPNMIDQFLANKNLLKRGSPISIVKDSARIEEISAMKSKGRYPQPIRFGGMGKSVNTNGFSDHYPISVALTEI